MSSDKLGIIAAFVERLQRLRVEIEASENPGVQKWAELQTVRETLRDLKASYPDDADLSECENVVEELISLSGRQFLLNVAHDITERKRAEEAIRCLFRRFRQSVPIEGGRSFRSIPPPRSEPRWPSERSDAGPRTMYSPG